MPCLIQNRTDHLDPRMTGSVDDCGSGRPGWDNAPHRRTDAVRRFRLTGSDHCRK
jgi:hypothetical protein